MTGQPDLRDLGLSSSASDSLHRAHALRLARTLDLPDDVVGESLPLTWIWVFFVPTVPSRGLREDGHPSGVEDGPLAALDRRMFIGGSLERSGPVFLDEAIGRDSRIVSADVKEGRSGQFVIVDVEHRYTQRDELVLVERQNLMYRSQPSGAVAPPGPAVEPPESGARTTVVPDERLLFRYSALTFNTHRIHYDLPYATGVENYPGLVVHGPLTATLLANLASEQLGGELSRFEFRATTPTFAGTPLHLTVESVTDGDAELRAVRDDGEVVMTARAST